MTQISHQANPDVLAALAIDDPLGVATLTLAFADRVVPGRPAVHRVETELRRLGALPGVDRAQIQMSLSTLERLLPAEPPPEGARGLVVFVGLATGATVTTELQVPVPTDLVTGRHANVRPLLRALEVAQPVGVARLSHEGVQLLEQAGGVLTELWAETLPELEGRSLVGPAHAHLRDVPGAAPGSHVGQQRDLYERRHLGEEQRLLTAAARRVAGEAATRGWRELVVADDPRLADAFVRGFTDADGVSLIPGLRLDRHGLTAAFQSQIELLVERTRNRAARALVHSIGELAGPGGRGALGTDEVAAALTEGRVDTLVVHPTATIAGRSSPSGVLAGPTSSVVDGADELTEDTMLADAMIARAYETGAHVVVCSPEVAEQGLVDQPVVALLRWGTAGA
ncbi:MAG: hypothetical protein ACKVUT_16445 [Gaiella sp.]